MTATRPNSFGDPVPVHDVYVRVSNVLRVSSRTEEVAGGAVILDWQRQPDGTERLLGVEVLAARGVEIDGRDVKTGRPHGTGPEPSFRHRFAAALREVARPPLPRWSARLRDWTYDRLDREGRT